MILVVDDHADTRRVMTRLIQRAGYTVECAQSGSDALEALERSSPQLILLDLMMPGMDGLQVLRSIREKAPDPNVPVIMFSASSDARQMLEAKRLHVTEFLTKASVPVDELLDKIKSIAGPPM